MDPLPSFESLKTQFDAAKQQAHRSEILKKAQERKVNRFKVSHGFLVAFLFCILCIHAIGIYIFSKGFLLTRLVLDTKSTCDVPPLKADEYWESGSRERGCWHPKTFSKAVIIVIDALRYDFAVPYQESQGAESREYHNELRVLHELALEDSTHALLLPFIADPPTTTLQRLKGLTTGTLPTFIDAGSNFAGTSIEEDNLIYQLNAAGKRIVHLGDDTWQALFPGAFDADLSHPYESLNVWDLHTVDNGVTEHLLPLLSPENSSHWDVIIGHYLGVDHAGHRYGPNHQAMAGKLRQMDRVIRNITQLIEPDTLLVIMGDHGMDVKGDHGGESDDELESTLFMYSPRVAFGHAKPEDRLPPAAAKDRPVAQIDLVSTLSLLMGVPIPYNNLGFPIKEAFLRANDGGRELAHAAQLTAHQIRRYQLSYQAEQQADTLEGSRTLSLADLGQEYLADGPSKPFVNWHDGYRGYRDYQREFLSSCRSRWAEFDSVSMITGLVILLGAVAVLVMLVSSEASSIMELVPKAVLFCCGGSLLGTLIGAAPSFFQTQSGILTSFGLLVGQAAGGLLGFAFSPLVLELPPFSLRFPTTGWTWFATLLTVAHSVTFASNSYTVLEDNILFYLLSSFSVSAFVHSFRCIERVDRILGIYESVSFLVLGRVASYSVLCREEQIPFCKSTYYGSLTSSIAAPWHLGLLLIVALAVPEVIRGYYNSTRSYEGPAAVWIGLGLRLGLALNALFWTIDVADDAEWFPELSAGFLKNVRVNIAQIVLGMGFVVGVTGFAWSSPCIGVSTSAEVQEIDQPKLLSGTNGSVSGRSSEPPSGIMRPGNGSAQKSDANAPSPSITILGYANVHGSRFFLLFISALLPLALLQKPLGAASLHIFALQVLSLLSIISTSESLRKSFLPPVLLGMLGNWYFFKTGHQATLASLQWDAAFIPLRSVVYPWSPLVMVANTFGAQILSAVAVPLIVLWKRDVKKEGVLGEAARAAGGFMLYHATTQLATTVCAWWLRRHLMLYRVFMPRFLLASAALVVAEVVLVLVAIGGVRWNSLSVGEIFGVF